MGKHGGGSGGGGKGSGGKGGKHSGAPDTANFDGHREKPPNIDPPPKK